MHILITNDDGYSATGIKVLAQELAQVADISVVAPDRNKSGASNSLTLMRPLRVERSEEGSYYVDGTPTDCVHLALSGLLDASPDMVVSGINAGPNLGDDVLYSGTVAAAMEGRYLGLPAIAVSLAGKPATYFETAAVITSASASTILSIRTSRISRAVVTLTTVASPGGEMAVGPVMSCTS